MSRRRRGFCDTCEWWGYVKRNRMTKRRECGCCQRQAELPFGQVAGPPATSRLKGER